MRKQRRGPRGRDRGSGGGDRPPHQPQQRADGARLARRADPNLALLYGFHPVREALRTGRRTLLRLYATEEAADRLVAEIAAARVPVTRVSAQELSARLGGEAVHQGALLEASALEAGDISDLEQSRGIVLVLDQVTDPHNFGAIVRTAAAFGLEALITTQRHAPQVSGVLAKAASGGLEHVPLIHVTNLARALDRLGDYGFLRVGLDSAAPISLDALSVATPLALVLGAEGQGLRRLTREKCDSLAKLDMPGPIKSLNVSNACAIALALVTRALKSAG